MRIYFLQQLLHAIPLLIVLSVVLFLVVRSAPGGPLAQAERNPNITAVQRESMRARLGLDQPLHTQYITWMSSVLQGDLGKSIKTNRPVAEMIGEHVLNTLLLVGTAFVLTVLIAIPLGAISALRQYSWFDHAVTTLSFAGQSVPVCWLGLVAILIFYVRLDNLFTGGPLLPAGGMYTCQGVVAAPCGLRTCRAQIRKDAKDLQKCNSAFLVTVTFTSDRHLDGKPPSFLCDFVAAFHSSYGIST